MKPLEAELALVHCRQARRSIVRLAAVDVPKKLAHEIEQALHSVNEIERLIQHGPRRSKA